MGNGDLLARIERLEDMEAIRSLILSYGPLADRGEAEAVSQLWTEDGIYAVGGYHEAKGREEIAALILSPMHQGFMKQGCAHMLSAPDIRIKGSSAVVQNYSVLFLNQGENFTPWRVSANLWKLIKSDSKWLVQRRDNAPLMGDDAARALLKI